MASLKSVFGNIWKGVKIALPVVGFVNPLANAFSGAIKSAEAAYAAKKGQGAKKTELVEVATDPIIDAMPFTDDQKARIKTSRRKIIAAEVAAMNAAESLKDAYDELDDLVESFQAKDTE